LKKIGKKEKKAHCPGQSCRKRCTRGDGRHEVRMKAAQVTAPSKSEMDYFSFHTGARFSRKAFTPSLASSVEQRRAKASFMKSKAL